jgi:hypothetical protein
VPWNHGSIPDWDSDYAYKSTKFRRNIDGDNFEAKVVRPKKEKKKVLEYNPYS